MGEASENLVISIVFPQPMFFWLAKKVAASFTHPISVGVNLLHTTKQRRALRQPIFQHSMATWTVEDQELKAVQL